MPTPGQILIETAGDLAELNRIRDTAEGGVSERVVEDAVAEKERRLAIEAARLQLMHEIAGASKEKAAAAAKSAVSWDRVLRSAS